MTLTKSSSHLNPQTGQMIENHWFDSPITTPAVDGWSGTSVGCSVFDSGHRSPICYVTIRHIGGDEYRGRADFGKCRFIDYEGLPELTDADHHALVCLIAQATDEAYITECVVRQNPEFVALTARVTELTEALTQLHAEAEKWRGVREDLDRALDGAGTVLGVQAPDLVG